MAASQAAARDSVKFTDEAGSMDGIHHPLKLRILYLWRNRHEIETARSETHAGW
ncbi:MAG: hypothetical protein HQ518_29660 [Rhodopirellula sp.]|nr:hypothetical protein [Rhodopirellula sp.]